jgi:hypothetical protein
LLQLAWSGSITLTLFGLGLYYLCREHREWRRSQGYVQLPPADRSHFVRQYFRRLQSSSLLMAAGIAIFLGLNVLDPQHRPLLYVWYWMGVLLAFFWIVALALADVLAIQRYARRHQRNLERERCDMIERQLVQYRARGNGHPGLPRMKDEG